MNNEYIINNFNKMTLTSVINNLFFGFMLELSQFIIMIILLFNIHLLNDIYIIKIIFAITFIQKIIHLLYYKNIIYNIFANKTINNFRYYKILVMNTIGIIAFILGDLYFNYLYYNYNYNEIFISFALSSMYFYFVNEIIENYIEYNSLLKTNIYTLSNHHN